MLLSPTLCSVSLAPRFTKHAVWRVLCGEVRFRIDDLPLSSCVGGVWSFMNLTLMFAFECEDLAKSWHPITMSCHELQVSCVCNKCTNSSKHCRIIYESLLCNASRSTVRLCLQLLLVVCQALRHSLTIQLLFALRQALRHTAMSDSPPLFKVWLFSIGGVCRTVRVPLGITGKDIKKQVKRKYYGIHSWREQHIVLPSGVLVANDDILVAEWAPFHFSWVRSSLPCAHCQYTYLDIPIIVRLQECSRCHGDAALYCGRACQIHDWDAHRLSCVTRQVHVALNIV